jgi:hypothetical protein
MARVTVTSVYLALCVGAALLVQTQRLTPADLALPLSVRALAAEPWRLILAFCYSDGLTVGLLLRMHAISCVSHTLEHVCCLVTAGVARRSPLRVRGRALHAACLLVGMAMLAAAALAQPAELAPPFFLGAFALFLIDAACRLPLPVARAWPALDPSTSGWPSHGLLAAGWLAAGWLAAGWSAAGWPAAGWLAAGWPAAGWPAAHREADGSGLASADATAGVGVPYAPWLPYGVLIGATLIYGAPAAFPLLGAIGAGVLFDCLDLLPTAAAKPANKPFGGAATAAAATATATAAATTAAATATTAAATATAGGERRGMSRRTGATAALTLLWAMVHVSDSPTLSPPTLPRTDSFEVGGPWRSNPRPWLLAGCLLAACWLLAGCCWLPLQPTACPPLWLVAAAGSLDHCWAAASLRPRCCCRCGLAAGWLPLRPRCGLAAASLLAAHLSSRPSRCAHRRPMAARSPPPPRCPPRCPPAPPPTLPTSPPPPTSPCRRASPPPLASAVPKKASRSTRSRSAHAPAIWLPPHQQRSTPTSRLTSSPV